MLNRLIRERNPKYLAVVFDFPAPTFRQKIYKEYKAHRTPPPDDLKVQIPVLKKVEGVRSTQGYNSITGDLVFIMEIENMATIDRVMADPGVAGIICRGGGAPVGSVGD